MNRLNLIAEQITSSSAFIPELSGFTEKTLKCIQLSTCTDTMIGTISLNDLKNLNSLYDLIMQ